MPDLETIVAGVLALQGDFEAHAKILRRLDAEVVCVRRPEQLERIACLCMPGGESTTMSLLLDSSGLREPLRDAIAGGLPTLATCAGAILLARRLEGDSGSLKVRPLELLDATVVRNAYGRQAESFEAEVETEFGMLRSIFIRAPLIRDVGPGVEVLGRHDGQIALVRQGRILAATFHTEVAGEPRLHEALLRLARY